MSGRIGGYFNALSINLKIAEMKSSILEKFKLKVKGYYLATIHRAENTDDKNRLKNILDQKVIIAIILGIVIPLIKS